MALTSDIKTVRYGSGDAREPANYQLGANVTVYRGSIAVLNGTGAHKGVLKNASTVASTDIVVGLIQKVGQGSGQIDGAPGIVGGATDGAVTVEVEQGTFFLGSSTGGDQLSVATIGQPVYLYDEQTVAATSSSGARPIAGIHVATDTSGKYPGGYAVKLGSNQTQTQAIGGGF
jgi:hypothetical protein